MTRISTCGEAVKIGLAGVTGFFLQYVVQAPETLRELWIWLITLFVVDTIIGFSYACFVGNVNSRSLWRGVIKLLSYFSLILIAAAIDSLLRTQYLVANIAASYTILTESISILENIKMCGIPVPTFLDKLIKRIMMEVERNCNEILPEEKKEK